MERDKICKVINAYINTNLGGQWVAKKSRNNEALIVIGRPSVTGSIVLELEVGYVDVAIFPNDEPKFIADGGYETIDPWYWTREETKTDIIKAIFNGIMKMT